MFNKVISLKRISRESFSIAGQLDSELKQPWKGLRSVYSKLNRKQTDLVLQKKLKKVDFNLITAAFKEAVFEQNTLNNSQIELNVKIPDFEYKGKILNKFEAINQIDQLLELGAKNFLVNKDKLNKLPINTDDRINNCLWHNGGFYHFLPDFEMLNERIIIDENEEKTTDLSPENPLILFDTETAKQKLQEIHKRQHLSTSDSQDCLKSMKNTLETFKKKIFEDNYSEETVFNAVVEKMTWTFNRYARFFADEVLPSLGKLVVRMGGEELEIYFRVKIQEIQEDGSVEEKYKKIAVVGDFDNFGILNSMAGSMLGDKKIPIPGDVKIAIIATHMEKFSRKVYPQISEKAYSEKQVKKIIQKELKATQKIISNELLSLEAELFGVSEKEALFTYQAIQKVMKPADTHLTYGTGTFNIAIGNDEDSIKDVAQFSDAQLTKTKSATEKPLRGTINFSKFVEKRTNKKSDREEDFHPEWNAQQKSYYLLRNQIKAKLKAIDFGAISQSELEQHLQLKQNTLNTTWRALKLNGCINEFDQFRAKSEKELAEALALVAKLQPVLNNKISKFIIHRIEQSTHYKNGLFHRDASKMAETDFLTGDLSIGRLYQDLKEYTQDPEIKNSYVFRILISKAMKIWNEGFEHMGGDLNIKIINQIVTDLIIIASSRIDGKANGSDFYIAKRFEPIVAVNKKTKEKSHRSAKKLQNQFASFLVSEMRNVLEELNVTELLELHGITDPAVHKNALERFLDIAEQLKKRVAYMRETIYRMPETELVKFEQLTHYEMEYHSHEKNTYDAFLEQLNSIDEEANNVTAFQNLAN